MNTEKKMQLILGRRSVRVYSPGEVDDAAIRKLLEASMAAPSAMTKDPWRFVVIRDSNRLASLAASLPGGKMLTAVPVAIVVCGDVDAAFGSNVGYLVQDCSAAIENLLLGAHALGLGACWVGIYPEETTIAQVKQILGLPTSILPVACVAIGHPGEELEARTRFNADYVHNETW